MLSNQLDQSISQLRHSTKLTFDTRTRIGQGLNSAGVQHSRTRYIHNCPTRPACRDTTRSYCTALGSSYHRHRAPSSSNRGISSHQSVPPLLICPLSSPGSRSSSRKPTAHPDVHTAAAAAAAAACPFPDSAGSHLQRHQTQWGSNSNNSSNSSAAGNSPGAEQLHPDVHQQFLGLGFRHSVEEAFKAFVHVPSSNWQQSESTQQQQQQAWQQADSSSCHHTSAVAQHDHSSLPDSRANSSTTAAAGSAAHQLTWQIKNCKSAAAVEALLQEHWRLLDHIHVSAAFVQLARLQRSSRSSSSGNVSPAGMQWFLQLAAHHLPQMHSRHISNILWACASLNLTPAEPWVKGFTDKAKTLFHKGTTPQGFSNIIWAVAVLKAPVSRHWINQFLAASQPHLFNFQPQELSSTIWALARMAVRPSQDWQYSFVVASTAKMASFNAQSLSNQLWAVAKLGLDMPQHWMAAVTYSAQIHAHDFVPLGLSNLLWGAAKLAGRSQQQQQQAAAAQWPQQQQPGGGAPASSSSSSSTQWIQPLLAAAAPKLQQYNAHTLSNVVWSLAVLDHRCSPEFLDQCFGVLLSKVDRLTPAGAAAALWGFGKLGMLPDPRQLALLLQQVQLLLPHNNAQQLVYIAAALALFKEQQQLQMGQGSSSAMFPDVFLQQYLAACGQQLQQQQITCSQACQLGRWLAAAAVFPEPQWTDHYLLYLAQQLPQLSPSHHVMILRTLSSWGLKPHEGWSAMFMATTTAEQRVATYTAEHVGTLLQGFVAAALQPQQQQLDVLLQQVLSPTAQVSAASTAAVLRGLCGVGCKPSEQWLEQFWEVGEPALAGSDAASLTSLAVALQLPELGQLQIRPSKLWGFAYHAAVAAVLNPSSSNSSDQKPGLNPQQAAAVLTALAATHRAPQQQHQSLLPSLVAAMAAGDGLSRLELHELVGALWALVFFRFLQQAVPLNHIYEEPHQQQPLVAEVEQPLQLAQQQQYDSTLASASQHQQPQQMRSQQQQQQQVDADLRQVYWLQHLFLRPDAESGLSQLSAHSLLKLSSVLGRLQQPTPRSWADSYAASMSVHLPQLAPHHLVSVLCAVPSLGGYAAQPALIDQTLTALQPVLNELGPKQLSEVITTVQRSGARPSEAWLSTFVAAAEARLPSFLSGQIIEVLGSLARLRYIPSSDFVTAAADLAVEKSGSFVAPALLVDLIWALTALRLNPSAAWMARFEARMLAKGLERLEAASISRFGWCLGALQRKPGQLLMAKYLAVAQQQHCNMSASSLADCIWACAMLDERPSKSWLESFLMESRKQLPSFPSSALVTVIWSLALLQCRPPSDWMDRCLAAIMACLGNTYGAAMAATAAVAPRAAASSSMSGVHLLQRPQLPSNITPAAATAAAVPPHLAPLTPSQTTDLVWSLAALDCRLPDQMMRLVIWQSERVISAVTSDDLAQLVWAIDRLDDTTGKEWVRSFAASARAQLLAAMSGSLTPGAGLMPLPQRGSASPAAMAAAGFKQLHGLSSMGQVVMIRPRKVAVGSDAADAGQQQLQNPGGLTAAAAAAAPKSLATGVVKTRLSKHELYAKLIQFQQQQQQHAGS